MLVMNKPFTHIEQAVGRVEQRFPGIPRREIIIARLFCHILPRMTTFLCEPLKEHGVNETVWFALISMYSCPEQALYPSDLSDVLASSRTNATRVSDELVKHGWAARMPCSDDRRKIRLELTPEGIRFVESILPSSREAHRDLWKDFDEQEKVLLESLMRKLLARLDD